MPEQSITDAIAAYAEGPDLLEASISGLLPEALDLSPGPIDWTIRQILHHVADGDEIWRVFVKRAIARPGGEFSLDWYWSFPQDDWPRKWAYAQRDVRLSLDVFRANRRQIAEMLRLAPGAWDNTLVVRSRSGEAQPVTVGWVVEMQTRHVVGHVDDIRKIREAHGM